MNEKPIIFSGPMVQAILEGRKTQTRQVVKMGILAHSGQDYIGISEYGARFKGQRSGDFYTYLCPYGQLGDLLWVRKTWALIWMDEPDLEEGQTGWDVLHRIDYRADTDAKYPGDWPDDMGDDPDCAKWKPSIHMPKKAARLWLRVTAVRVERVQEISQEDAKAEGVYHYWANCCDTDKWPQGWPEDAYNPEIGALSSIEVYHLLWDSINAKRGYGWNQNSWVWVIEFERYEKTND